MVNQPLFPAKERTSTNPQVLQDDQLRFIYSVLGLPSEADWPALRYLDTWKTVSGWKVGCLLVGCRTQARDCWGLWCLGLAWSSGRAT